MEQITRYRNANTYFVIVLTMKVPGVWETSIKASTNNNVKVLLNTPFTDYNEALKKYRRLVRWNTGKEPVYA